VDALERLLTKASMAQLDVEQIAAEAGITRTRFYAYYTSKNGAPAALLRRLVGVNPSGRIVAKTSAAVLHATIANLKVYRRAHRPGGRKMSSIPLADWSNFYVIVGSAAGSLTGLTFVVIALSSGVNRANMTGIHTFLTPTIVHFCNVLALAAFLSVPRQSVITLSIGFAAPGVAGLIYVASIARRMRGIASQYVPVREDWLWNVIVPAAMYGTYLAMAFLAWHDLEHGLYGVAATSLGLLLIGIRNSWDVAVWNSSKKQPDAQ
jgi:AcrR family transcriptional regulator